jgi:hypothetical protein
MLRARKVAKKRTSKSVNRMVDKKVLGNEPDLRGDTSNTDLIKALSWYRTFYDKEDSKKFTIAYMLEEKQDKEFVRSLRKVDADKFSNLGFIARILSLGGVIPIESLEHFWERVRALPSSLVDAVDTPAAAATVAPVSVQDRVRNRAENLIADLEDSLDIFYRDGETFNAVEFLRANDVKGQVASKIADYYRPLYAEVFDALQGKDPQLKEAYSSYKKAGLKTYVDLVKSILSACETMTEVTKKVRKPRAKKEKPAAVLVAKVKYKAEDETFKIKSENPANLIGASQAWLFNTKYRALTVLNALGPTGLSVKGTTVTGFDEKTSVTKKLRKPEVTLGEVTKGGKITLRKLMETIKTKETPATGRINNEVVLVRIIK